MRWTRRSVASLGTGLIAFLLYASCLSTTVTYGGDCGELISASWRLGIAHPTGYALFCLLGRLFATLFPIGEVGFRYNVLSALFGASAVGLVTASVHRLTAAGVPASPHSSTPAPNTGTGRKAGALWMPTLQEAPAIGAGLLLAGMFYFWSQATIAEVYSLNALMLALVFYAAVVWHQEEDWRWAYTTSALIGLSFTAHLSCIYFMPGLLLFGLVQHRARFGGAGGMWRHGVRLVAFAVLAYLLVLYLPLRSSTFPAPQDNAWWPLDWTHPTDLHRFVAHISARQYSHLLMERQEVSVLGHTFHISWFAQPWSVTRGKLAQLAFLMSLQLFWAVPIAFIGLFVAWRKRQAVSGLPVTACQPKPTTGFWLGLLLLSAFSTNIFSQIHYKVGDQSNFFFPAYIVLAVWIGLGIATLLRWKPKLAPLWIFAIASVFLLQVGFYWPMSSQAGNTSARDLGLASAATAEKLYRDSGKTPTLILSSDDALWSFFYAKYALGRAPHSLTPWGNARKNVPLTRLVTTAKRTGPAVVSQWNAAADLRFPFVRLSDDGSLYLASDRKLPPPAQPFDAGTAEKAKLGDKPAMLTFLPTDRTPEGMARVKRDNLTSVDITFRLPFDKPLAAAPGGTVTVASAEGAMHVGYIEMMVARASRFTKVRPDQGSVRDKNTAGPPLVAWRQDRRLIVPLGAKTGQMFRVAVPFDANSEAQTSVHRVWLRLVRTPNDRTTPWLPVEPVVFY